MAQQSVYEYVKNTSKSIDKHDFEMLHQFALDKIRSCDFGPDYKYKCIVHYYTLARDSNYGKGCNPDEPIRKFDTQKEFRDALFWDMHGKMDAVKIQSFYEKVHLPLFVYEYIYNHILYPKFIHQYLKEHKLTNDLYAYISYRQGCGSSIFGVTAVHTETDNHSEGPYEATYSHRYIPYHLFHRRDNYTLYELYDIYPQYVEPKHSKQDYINYFITNDFNCNRLRKMIIELSKIMLARREEDITQHVKSDTIIDDLQLLINYAQQMVIDCKEYLDKQMNDATVKLSF